MIIMQQGTLEKIKSIKDLKIGLRCDFIDFIKQLLSQMLTITLHEYRTVDEGSEIINKMLKTNSAKLLYRYYRV